MSGKFKCQVFTKEQFFNKGLPIEDHRENRVAAFKTGQSKTVIAITFPNTPENDQKIKKLSGYIFTYDDGMPILRHTGKPETMEKMELANNVDGEERTIYFKGDPKVADTLSVYGIINLPKCDEIKRNIASLSVPPRPRPGPSYDSDNSSLHLNGR